ncbi:hypothetical protein HYH03_006660 [Edaphochlamys debaryana]|uniref:Uncharacterized protein n=1 Tax=Edaphochlamys debaryana TaxID=47281 RepID=A0A835Y3S5_9CHLO|nr:hypothetical protein HYH03_006660 [Edaphochlamys debaryana]|eukprot:KAG2495393.1 hypothetical protein HYH03_006660 [Edaphochlamys debaryana]
MSGRGRGRGYSGPHTRHAYDYDDYGDSYASKPRGGRGGGYGYGGYGGGGPPRQVDPYAYPAQYAYADPAQYAPHPHAMTPAQGWNPACPPGPNGGPPAHVRPRAPYQAPSAYGVPQQGPVSQYGGGPRSSFDRPGQGAASGVPSVRRRTAAQAPLPAAVDRDSLLDRGVPASAPVSARSGSASPKPEAEVEPEAPTNPHFLTPAFPQPPRTRTDSCSCWALMVEAGCQALEAVVGPFLEGALMELFGEGWERELFSLELPLPPLSASACAQLIARCKQLHERLPITIHKRVEAVSKATTALSSAPGSLEPEDVAACQAACKGLVQDCIKAMKLPSLMGAGSKQWRAFTAELMPQAESAVAFYDVLLTDCSEAAALRQQVRATAAAEAGGVLALASP